VVTSLYDVFATLGDARRRYGSEAVGLYIISMARSAADVLAVLALARYGGLVASSPLPSGERAGVRGMTRQRLPEDKPRPNATTKSRARRLRRDQTDVEQRLWHALRDRRLDGAKFRRQAPIGPYIVDFVCPARRLIVERWAARVRIESRRAAHALPRKPWLSRCTLLEQ
jgi:hypothetical protein